ncbi:hypothetical protein BsWGS_11774 [Bradybaena similaris]
MADLLVSSSVDDDGEQKQPRRCQQYEAVIEDHQWPIIYSPEYNIGFFGIEKLQTFDLGKWSHIVEYLKGAGMIRDETIVEPMEASEDELLFVHSKRYLNNLKWNLNLMGITDMPPVALLPNFIVQKKVLRPFRYQTSGTIMAGRLAVERGWAINIGGGFHHCSHDTGGGFCAYADITLAVRFVFEKLDHISRVMIIDLDAHQGNGHERDFMGDKRVYILDIYNRDIYPQDGYAKRAIHRKVELRSYIDSEAYLILVRRHVDEALADFLPHLVVYNAGTDILAGDPTGKMTVSAQGVIERDQIVFQRCRTQNIPIFMLTSGGYLRDSAKVVSDSILNLRKLGLISCDAAETVAEVQCEAPSLPRSHSDGGLFARFKRSYLTRSSTSTQNISNLGCPIDSCTVPGMFSFAPEDDKMSVDDNNF